MSTARAIDARWGAVLAGLSRGWIETRHSFTEIPNIIGHVFFPMMSVFSLLISRGKTLPGTDFSVAAMMLPGLVGFLIVFGGISGPAASITADREDGTLLRAKATPHGMLGYLIGKIVMLTLTTLLGLLVLLVVGAALVSNPFVDARSCLLLALIFIVGMVSTVPIGVALGSIMKSSLQAMLVPLACALLLLASGIFYPIARMPAWLQSFAQLFPFYWVGLGARAAMLPAEMVVLEVGKSWRSGEMFAVLSAWAAMGLLLAPILLRRMARRQAGSAVTRVRERIMSKGY
jgi:ABC-2 type transport system permease protein